MSMPHASCSGLGASDSSSTCTVKLASYEPSAWSMMFTVFGLDGSSRVQRSLTRPIFGSVRKPHLHPSACPTLNRADLVNSADCSPSLRLLYRGSPVRCLFPVRRLVTICVLPAL